MILCWALFYAIIQADQEMEVQMMAYTPNYYQNYQYPMQNMPMDRLQQLQAQYQAPQQMQAPPQTNQGILWVQGEAGAKSYLVTPGTSVLLMDSESERFFVKTTDVSGMPQPLRIFKYTECDQNAQEAPKEPEINLDEKYVAREEYDVLKEDYEDLIDRMKLIEKKLARNSKGVKDDE